MNIGILKETFQNEQRVVLIPQDIAKLIKKGFSVFVEKGAGEAAGYNDELYAAKEATLADRDSVIKQATIIPSIHTVTSEVLDTLQPDTITMCLLDPYFNEPVIRDLAKRKLTSFSLEFIPRISRAQSMDVLTSMSSIAGYKAVIAAAHFAPGYFPMIMSAAGTVIPSKVFILGAGVAGLQAIATAKRLGADVTAYDIRPVVKEQVESLGAKFFEMDLGNQDAEDKGGYAKALTDEQKALQQKLMTEKIASSDVVITTALIPGRKAPILISDEMIQQMKPGAVIVDIATKNGGNVEGNVEHEVITKHGVTIIGYSDYESRTAHHASQLFSKNVSTFIFNMLEDEKLNVEKDDEVVTATLMTYKGEIVNPRYNDFLSKSK
jgi:NAD(P) transhydrogenase subunit alpha